MPEDEEEDARPDLREAADVPESEERSGSKTDSGLAGRIRSLRKRARKKRTKAKARRLKRKSRFRSATSPLREAAQEARSLADDVRGDSTQTSATTADDVTSADEDEQFLAGLGVEPGDAVDADGDGFAEFEAIDTDGDGFADTLEEEPPVGDVEDDVGRLDPDGVEEELGIDFPVEDNL